MRVFSGSVSSLVIRVERALIQGKINHALVMIHDFVERIITEPICVAQVFSSHILDELCIKIGNQNLENLIDTPVNPWANSMKKPIALYIVSRLQRSGGHSRLIQDFIRSQPAKNHFILSTEIGGPSDKDYIKSIFAADNNVNFLYADNVSFASRLSWLQSMLITVQPEHVYLFNHHQDSVAVAALVPQLKLKGSFFHHGDHHLCLGVHMNYLNHVDLHPMGFHYCRDELGIDNLYMPLTFEDKKYIEYSTEFVNGGYITTATAARSNKVEIPYYVSYVDMVPKIMKATGGKHIHIGRLTPWALSRIYKQLRKHGINKDRFVYLQWTPSVWQSLQKYNVDVYIASFPYGAGLTLIEAMGAGVPVIMHQHMYSRVLSGLELAYPEAFCWADPGDLLTHLETVTVERLASEKILSRKQYESFHRSDILKTFLKDPVSIQQSVPQLSKEFRPRYDEWAAWVESQFTLSKLIYRSAYRAWRKVRRLVG
ncbi:hypothetical protein [Advenella alkanexedens]|uniref:hypothetical protein n=1 Tax=Advenella alkanexedens TaxID=1481665 RepID=UPI00267495E3|nr:hypothetical protein [Advenella alkanexedens]WKU19958.1 hypothetical protein Q3V95_02650 [Advenella alkanexedens]